MIKNFFHTLWEQRSECGLWFTHNVIFGLCGVWLPFLALGLFGKCRVKEVFLDGSLLMFAVTLSAVSMGFFIREKRVSIRRALSLTYGGLLLTLVMGSGAACVLAIAQALQTGPPKVESQTLVLSMPVVMPVSIVITLMAIIFNFRTFMAELEQPSTEGIRDELDREAQSMAAKAKTGNKASGVQL